MLFSSIPFLFYFLPCVLVLYFAVPRVLKNSVLLLSSLVFYAWGEPKYVILMLISITTGYIFGLLIEKFKNNKVLARILMIVSIAISLGMLGYLKYADFFISNINAVTGLSVPLLRIALPIGISFYTFQILSYTVDVYRGDVKAQKNYISLATYVALFPQLIAGPIVRYSDIAEQLGNRKHTAEKIATGIKRFILGLTKKILIANVLGELCSTFKSSDDKSVLFFWLYAIAYTLHIYFDFSGYSDMAIGLGKIFGFDFLENFNYPYISKSITEFWRRWHMSLGSWFRDYVYIPLGGNRVNKFRHFINILVVWMLTGFWHGAAWNFIVWGLYFAVLLTFEKYVLSKVLNKSKVLCHIYVMLLIIISFVIFDAADMGTAFKYIAAMFGAGNYPVISSEFVYYLRSYGVVLIVAIVSATPVLKIGMNKLSEKAPGVMAVVEPLIAIVGLVLCAAFLVDGSYNPFLYFRF